MYLPPLERPEERQEREALHYALEAFLDRRSVDDDNVSRIDLRILGLSVPDRNEIERGSLALPADRPEDRHPMGVRVFGRATRKGDGLHQRRRSSDRE